MTIVPRFLRHHTVHTGDGISQNGMELMRNIPQDAKTRNGNFKPTIDRHIIHT